MRPGWRYIRIVVDVPVKGDVREKDIIWGVNAAIQEGHHHIKKRGFGAVAYGQVEVKSFAKVMAHENKRREENE